MSLAVKWPTGFASAGGHCGIKRRSADLGVIVAEEPTVWAGVFTTNAAAAAPVLWCRSKLGTPVRAVVVNSGNANACTGKAGTEAVTTTAEAAASLLGCTPDEVLVASTGPIGVTLPVEKISSALPDLVANLTADPEPFATSIITTDTYIKTATAQAGEASIVGVAKGAAMIAPNMATMLAFIATDADIDAGSLEEGLATAVDRSFNRISVDACESTNDSVIAMATRRVSVDATTFADALATVCASLAEQIVRDAEGATKLMRIEVCGAPDEAAAVVLGRAVAASDLWRAAVAGADPNWGRILSALGGADRTLDLALAEISIGGELVFYRGEPMGSLEVAAKAMGEDEFSIGCVVGSGPGAAVILAADLTKEYVALNSEITT